MPVIKALKLSDLYVFPKTAKNAIFIKFAESSVKVAPGNAGFFTRRTFTFSPSE
ncbi:hypothetical protein [Ensifer adhaerens]|uniref:hypothetical protein n=1 Tax=Ensifer adhaerens TaxID=106592 RepID=UPI001C4DF5DC|nr:hypothetical protein [Ensifer adhaerens]MBW0365842.1 hypothetical protein [Ensifer adhaerens]UCM20253.1 hypothetical protein LDL63_01205 [Ensifer adhaerens]